MNNNATRNRPLTTRYEPEITIGPHDGDIRGDDDKALQAGMEYLHRMGGGLLNLLPGEYAMHNALYLRPHVTIRGAGPGTVLKKSASCITRLTQDADWYEACIHVAHTEGFKVGGGIMLRSYPSSGESPVDVVKDTVTAIDGQVISLTRRMEKNMWLAHNATAASVFPIITAERVDDVTIENLVLDGNRDENEEINGNYAGAVFIQYCNNYTFRNVVARHYNGDGFSFQVCDDIHLEGCKSENNANLGFHPGSGSQRPVFARCESRGNSQGIFFCWGVSDGLVDACRLTDNHDFGLSIGHRDTDTRIVNSLIENNARGGILFRDEGERVFLAGHRTSIESSIIRDNGFAAQGAGVDIRGQVHDTIIRHNRLEDSGQDKQKIGIRIRGDMDRTHIEDNTFIGLEDDIRSEGNLSFQNGE
jgi:hypothetical protein